MNIYIAKTKFVKYAFYALYIHHIYIYESIPYPLMIWELTIRTPTHSNLFDNITKPTRWKRIDISIRDFGQNTLYYCK